jgi:2-C-methyl-D-erythritol 4-phosphate cytidylyltransferase
VPALPLADTVKRAEDDGRVVETIDRAGLFTVQTPQAFVGDVLRRALEDGQGEHTDCAAFVEASGGRVRIVEGDPRLLKVTTRSDLALVEALLSR